MLFAYSHKLYSADSVAGIPCVGLASVSLGNLRQSQACLRKNESSLPNLLSNATQENESCGDSRLEEQY